MGVEVVLGALIAWAIAKARRVGREADEIADEVIDAGAARVHDLVMAKLGADPALAKLEIEASRTEAVSERTLDRARLAIEDAIEEDHEFATELAAAVAQLRPEADRTPTITRQSVSGKVTGPNIMVGGNLGGSVHIGVDQPRE